MPTTYVRCVNTEIILFFWFYCIILVITMRCDDIYIVYCYSTGIWYITINYAIIHSPRTVFIHNIISRIFYIWQYYNIYIFRHTQRWIWCISYLILYINIEYGCMGTFLLFSPLPSKIELHPQDSCQVMTACVTNSSCSTCVFRIKESRTNCFVITFPWEEFECFALEN